MAFFSIVFVFPVGPPGFSGYSPPPPHHTVILPLGLSLGICGSSASFQLRIYLNRLIPFCFHMLSCIYSVIQHLLFEVVFVAMVTLYNKYEAFRYLCVLAFIPLLFLIISFS